MIETRYGNALDVEAGIIVHGCNCQGVMGGGIAREVRERFPSAYDVYYQKYKESGLKLGEITFAEVAPNKFIVNANTQDNFGYGVRQVSYDAVVVCFEEVMKLARLIETDRKIRLDVIFPMIGAGLGGGKWPIIEASIDVTVSDDFKKVLFKLPETK